MARALGKGDDDMAAQVLWHAVLIGIAMSIVFVAVLGFFSLPIFALLGGEGIALEGAVAYAQIAFGAAIAIWMLYIFSAALREGQLKIYTTSRLQ